MASRSRRKSKLPWIALILLVAGVVGLYFYFNGDESLPSEANADVSDESADQQAGVSPVARRNDTPTRDARADASPSRNNATSGRTAVTTSDHAPGPTPRRGTAQQRPTQRDLSAYARQDDVKLTGEAKDQYQLGLQKLEEGDLVTGRALLSELLFREGTLPKHEAAAVRQRLTFENQRLVFSREKVPNDTITLGHKVQSGEYLSTIANTYRVPYQFIERMNNIEARRLQAGQTIKVLRGPVHARVDKSEYRLDLYVEDLNGLKVYLKSYTIGLGEFDSTPVGLWRIKPGSKVGPENGGPSWRNPRTGEVYDRDDPDIPIGEYWMALEGLDENTKNKAGYGIHATNDPDSIGRQESMGCIRMRDEDVDEVFYTLYEGLSLVEIVP